MNMDNINTIAQIVLVVHTLILYPIFKFVYLMEKRVSKLEISKELQCDVKCAR